MNATKYEISTGEELIDLLNDSLRNRNDFKGDSIIILSDLDLTKYSTIPKFNGFFDGKGHTIRNQKGPLFTMLDDCGIITNVTWGNSCSINSSNQGIAAKICKGLISNCINYGSFSQNSSKNIDIVVGGFCSQLNGGIISDSHNFNSCFTGTFVDNTLTITVGGICAESSNGAIIINCSNNAKLRHYPMTKLIAGGIVGIAANTKIINCSNNELVLSNIEDITSLTSSQIDIKVGGICGLARNCEINHCLNDYLIQTNTGYSAGIVAIATDTDIRDCINRGKINNTDSYYYSNSAGIVCDIENNETKDFLNCVNFGEIISYTENAIATGAGVSSNISNANIGMVANFGSVDVMARGTLARTFKYNNYNANNSHIIEDSSDFTKWNEQININYKYLLSNWDLTNPEDPVLQPSLWFGAKSFSNCGQTSIEIFAADFSQKFNIELINMNEEIVAAHNNVSSRITFTNLTPGNNYIAKVRNSSLPLVSDNFTEAYVHMDIPEVTILFNNIDFESCDYNVLWHTSGLCINSINLSIYEKDSNKLHSYITETKGSLNDLLENTTYVAHPKITTVINGEQNIIEFPTTDLRTSEYSPMFNIQSSSNNASVECTNFHLLRDRQIGFSLNDSIYLLQDYELIELQNLDYGTDYSLIPIVKRNNTTTSYQPINFTTELDGYFSPISISRNGAIILATVYKGQDPNATRYNYSEYYIEYRNISDDINIKSKTERVYIVDHRNLTACYIPFSSDNIIQYRAYSKSDYYYSNNYYHSWYIVNQDDAFDEVVIPHFFNCRCYKYNDGEKFYISCLPIRGDEEILEWGIAYKYVKSASFSETKSNLSSGNISIETSKFVPNLEYRVKFYGKTQNKTYYSQEYSYQNHELSLVEGTDDSGVIDINNDSPSAKPIYYYNIMGNKSMQPFEGINIVIFDDGHREKLIIRNK